MSYKDHLDTGELFKPLGKQDIMESMQEIGTWGRMSSKVRRGHGLFLSRNTEQTTHEVTPGSTHRCIGTRRMATASNR